jgi:hypothetical protein
VNNWQSPAQEVEVPLSKSDPNITAWAYWAGPNAVEIRVVKYKFTIVDDSSPEQIFFTDRKTWALLPTGEWAQTRELEVIAPCRILTAEEAFKVGIKPLKDDIHVYRTDKDCCLRCGYNGQQVHRDREAGFELHCLGWLEVKIG